MGMAELLHLFWYIAHNVHVKYGEVCYNKINVTIQNPIRKTVANAT